MIGQFTCGVVIPARNEEANLSRLLDLLPQYLDEVIVVVGGSKDETLKIAQQHNRTTCVLEQSSRGKGAALSLGFQFSSAQLIAIMDADGSMNSDELANYYSQLVEGSDVVKGSRYLLGGGSSDLTRFRSFGNKCLTKLANLLFKQKWTDLAYGYAAFRREAVEALEISHLDEKVPRSHWLSRGMAYGQGFEIETLMFCRSARRGMVVTEIPSVELSRWSGSTNLIAIPDGIRAGIALLTEMLRSRRQYKASSGSSGSVETK